MSSNPPPVKNGETPTTDTLLARPWVSRLTWSYLFRRRQELGVARYGTPLQPFNGRDAILDAAEEFQDATVYAEQCIREGRVPLLAGAALQILCLFALRVLWHYAGVATRERILGRDRPLGVGDATLLSPRELVEDRLPDIGPGPCPILVGTYDPPDSQEPPGFLDDMPTMSLRPVPCTLDARWDLRRDTVRGIAQEDIGARQYGWLRALTPRELGAPLNEDTGNPDDVGSDEERAPIGYWSNVAGTWKWKGVGTNRSKGNSVAAMLDREWQERAWRADASEA